MLKKVLYMSIHEGRSALEIHRHFMAEGISFPPLFITDITMINPPSNMLTLSDTQMRQLMVFERLRIFEEIWSLHDRGKSEQEIYHVCVLERYGVSRDLVAALISFGNRDLETIHEE